MRYARLAAAVGGVAMVLWLVYAELFIIDAICLYCTVVHGLTLLLFLSSRPPRSAAPSVQSWRTTSTTTTTTTNDDDDDDEPDHAAEDRLTKAD